MPQTTLKKVLFVTTSSDGDVFVGLLPADQGIANTAIQWAGVAWTMMIWPPPADRADRACLMMHELWHRIQDDIGFHGSMPSNSHLDTPEGRLWMQLEWRALHDALASTGDERQTAMKDALVFRAQRRPVGSLKIRLSQVAQIDLSSF